MFSAASECNHPSLAFKGFIKEDEEKTDTTTWIFFFAMLVSTVEHS